MILISHNGKEEPDQFNVEDKEQTIIGKASKT